jgi:hypothetical protein
MKRLAFILALVLNSIVMEAQILEEIGESFRKKPKFFFNFTQYNSFINKQPANVSGIKAGLEFNDKVRLGVGYGWLNSDIVDRIDITKNDLSYQTNGQLKFNFVSTSFEYEFYSNYPWHISVPLVVGAGGAHYEYIDRMTKERTNTNNFPVVLFEPTINAQYNIIDWVGVSGGLGYRFTMNATMDLKRNFCSPIYVIQLKIFFDEIYRDLFPNGPLTPKGGKKQQAL